MYSPPYDIFTDAEVSICETIDPFTPPSSIDPSQIMKTPNTDGNTSPDQGFYPCGTSPALSDSPLLFDLTPTPPTGTRVGSQPLLQQQLPPTAEQYQDVPSSNTIYHSPIQQIQQTRTPPSSNPSPERQRHPYFPPHHRTQSQTKRTSPAFSLRRSQSPYPTGGITKNRPLPPTSSPFQYQATTSGASSQMNNTANPAAFGSASANETSTTTAPSSNSSPTISPSPAEMHTFQTHQESTTLVLGLLLHLDRLTQECEEMRQFIKTGYNILDTDTDATSGALRQQVEGTRLVQRNQNRLITELHEPLQILLLLDGRAPSSDTPSTGRDIQLLDHATVGKLLDQYDIPFVPTMFLHEKKAAYLRFVGAGRALMHRVLDW